MGCRRWTRCGALALLLMALTGCASIPLGTMWRLHSLDISDLGNLNPADIRVVIKLPENLQFVPEKATLVSTLTPRAAGAKPLVERAPLVLLKKGRYVPAHVPVAQAGYVWYLTALSAEGQTAFRELQQELIAGDFKQRFKGWEMSVKIPFPGANKQQLEHARWSVWLHLNPDDDYFPLFKNAALASN
jgi:hypothetical protein